MDLAKRYVWVGVGTSRGEENASELSTFYLELPMVRWMPCFCYATFFRTASKREEYRWVTRTGNCTVQKLSNGGKQFAPAAALTAHEPA